VKHVAASGQLRDYLFVLIFLFFEPSQRQSQQFVENSQSDVSGEVSADDGTSPQSGCVYEGFKNS
jgi:hypothetical protein